MTRKVALLLATATGTIALASCDEALKTGPGGIVAVVLAPDSIELAVGNSFQFRAAPVDSTGALLQGLDITWMSSDPGVASVNQEGAVVGIAPGTATITASVEGIDRTSVARVDLAPSIGLSSDTVRFAAQAGGADPPVDSVTVANGGGFVLEGLSVTQITFADSIAGWLTATLDSTTAPATLRLTAVSTGITVAGTYNATVELDAFEASNRPRGLLVQLILGAGTPTVAAASAGDNQVGVAGGALVTLPSVQITDQFGNPVPGITVTFSVTGGGGSITGAAPVTDAQGVATVGSWTLGSGLGTHTLQAVIVGLPPITFTATANAAPASIVAVIAGDGQSAVAGMSVPTAPQVQVTDAFGNPVAGIGITFAVTAGGGSTVGPSQTTDAGGFATVGAWTLGTVAGTNTLRATATGVPDTATFTASGIAGAAAQIAVAAGDAQTDTVAATLLANPSVIVSDINGNPVAGVQVTYTVASGGGSVTGGVVSTDAAGVAEVGSWTLGTVAVGQSLTATAAGVGITGNPVTINATATAGGAFALAVGAGDNQSATSGTVVGIPPEALATDQFGNPIAGIDVTFAVTSGGGTITGPSQTTDAAGTARVTSWTLGVAVGSNTLQATTPFGLTGEPVVFTATGISGTATNMALVSGDAQIDTIGAPLPTPYTVRITDTNDNGVSGIPVAWNVTGGGGSITPTSTTDASGFASATHTLGDALGAQTVDAAVGGLTGSPVALSSTATVGNPATVSMIPGGNNQTAVVNTAVAIAPEVLVVDRVGNPIVGASVSFTPTAGGGSALGGSPPTGANGQAAVTSWTLGTGSGSSNNALQALVAGSGIANNPLTFLASATPGAVDLAVSTITASAGSITASTGSSASTITVTVTDQFGNARVGETVTLSATGTPNTFSPNASATTDAAGQLVRSFSSTQALAKTISATVTGPGVLASTAAVTVNPAPVSLTLSTMDATEPITASAGTILSTVTITVRDQFSNPRSGHSVTIAVSGSGNGLNQPGSATNASGQTTGTWSSTVAQVKTVSATVTGVGQISLVDNVTVNPGTATQLAMVTNPSGATSNVNFSTQPSVRLRDQFGNNVSQSGVSLTASRISGNGALQGTTSRTTNTSGVATWTNLQIDGGANRDLGTGSHRLRFVSSGLTLVESSNFTVLVSYAYNLRDNFLTSRCAGCHTWNPDMNWSRIAPNVVVSGSSCTSVRLIDDFNTSNSIIWRKSTSTPPCGSRMPTSGSFLSTTRQNLLATWINQGASNN